MNSFLTECQNYLLVGFYVQGVGALVVAPFFFLVANRLGYTAFPRLLRAYLVFNACLLFWGCLGHYVFHSLTYGRLYVSADRVVDWWPFIPFGQWVIDQSLGSLRGHLIAPATLGQLRLLWLAAAVPVWLLTYASTLYIARLRFPHLFTFTHANRAA